MQNVLFIQKHFYANTIYSFFCLGFLQPCIHGSLLITFVVSVIDIVNFRDGTTCHCILRGSWVQWQRDRKAFGAWRKSLAGHILECFLSITSYGRVHKLSPFGVLGKTARIGLLYRFLPCILPFSTSIVVSLSGIANLLLWMLHGTVTRSPSLSPYCSSTSAATFHF